MQDRSCRRYVVLLCAVLGCNEAPASGALDGGGAGTHAATTDAQSTPTQDAASAGTSADADTSKLDASTAPDAADDAAASTTDAAVSGKPHCKRGVGYGHHSPADLTALSPGVHWWYNWSPKPETQVAATYAALDVEFAPMVWGGSFDVATVSQQIVPEATTLLAFNEPNFYSQANLTAVEAAALWPKLEQIADAHGLAITSPALNYCGGGCNETDPFKYLDAFFAACTSCRVDYIAAHWYACDGPALEWYLGQLEKYGKPIWLTEFSCGDGADRSLAVQKKYMTDAVKILEDNPLVERYAWFAGRTTAIPNVDLLGADGQLTELGQLYLSLPHHDPACAR